jgi:hypothetical protein
MVNFVFLFILFGLQAFHIAHADESVAEAIQPHLHRLKLPPIKDFSIDENGAKSPADKASLDECGMFILKRRDVEEYFKRAGEVEQHDYFHLLDWSPCYASGKIVFAHGLTGTWGIQQFRAGSLSLSDGRTIYLYCPKCRAKAFAPRP